MVYQILADIILVFHALIVTFVVIGFLFIITGIILKWSFIRIFWFRILHLSAIGIVVVQSWLGVLCPFTRWESSLRQAAGEIGYSTTFVQHWLEKLIFYDFGPWLFICAYTIFGILVIIAWFIAPPVIPWHGRKKS